MPFKLDRVKADAGAEGDGGEERELVAGVDAADVKVGVGLKIAKLAGLFEHRLIGQAGRLHPGQDVVAGAVHHAHHALDPVGGKAFGQRLDDRDAAGNGGLEADHAALRLGGKGKGLAVMGEQRLVGGDHILAGGDGGFGRGKGRAVVAAHHLDEDIDVVAAGEGDGVGLPGIGGKVGVAVLFRIPGRDGGDLHGAAGRGR